MIDHVSDTLVDPFVPLTRMVTAAEMGNIASVEECSAQFTSHAERLAHVCITHKSTDSISQTPIMWCFFND